MLAPAYTLDQDTEEFTPEQLAAIYLKERGYEEPYYTTEELEQTFIIEGFLMPYCLVTRKTDQVRGLMTWIDLNCVMPGKYARLYFGFSPA